MVRLESNTRRWTGLSTDTKPFPGMRERITEDGTYRTLEVSELPAGSSFLESDTGRIYRWTGAGWSLFVPEDEQLHVLQVIARQLGRIETILKIVHERELRGEDIEDPELSRA